MVTSVSALLLMRFRALFSGRSSRSICCEFCECFDSSFFRESGVILDDFALAFDMVRIRYARLFPGEPSILYSDMLFSRYNALLSSHASHVLGGFIPTHILICPGGSMFLTSTPFRNSAIPGIVPCLINSALWLMIGSIIILATATTVSPLP